MTGLKKKEPWELITDEAYEELCRRFQANQNLVAWSFILWACLAGIAVPILLWNVPKSALPASIHPFWNVYGISVLLMLPMLLLRWTPFGREAQGYKGIGRAINAFEGAKVTYAKWKQTHARRDLNECYERLKLSEKYLQDVPMFKAIQKEINTAYQEFFDNK
ncbi:MAG TPA: hypothetical protein PLA03_03345 [Acidobacteriota bacterium]|nr:hypothetical protein [Acidobacteriota bacterium]